MNPNSLLKELNSKYLLRIGRETNYFYSNGERVKEGDIVEIYNDPKLGRDYPHTGYKDIYLGEFILKNRLVAVFDSTIGDHILTTRIQTPICLALKCVFYGTEKGHREAMIKIGEVENDSFDFSEENVKIYKDYSEIYDREYRKINPPQEKPKQSFFSWLFN